jgi:hypothetical protein
MKKKIGLIFILMSFLITIVISAQTNKAEKNSIIVVDGTGNGRTYQAIGGVSAGGSSRLLYDYPEPERSQILDYLFKPNYGANIQILKVEIGGDINSTDGAEAGHMRTPDEINCNRGYEWWLMKEARKRNPEIKLAGLAWGSPGWIGKTFWTDENIIYHLAWLDCAEQNGLKIDYMGGWNERGYNVDWYIKWRKALKDNYPHIELIGGDECCREDLWRIVDDMYKNKKFMDAIDHVAVHFACGHRTGHKSCYSPEHACDLDKPLWMSENSAQNHDIGSLPAARALNRMYIDARITGYMTWSPVSAWYSNMELADTGILLAEWPWSGYYQVGKSIWVFAHTAQFVQPGWKYIDAACGYLGGGASYVSLQSESKRDFSIIIEAVDAEKTEIAEFSLQGGLSAQEVYVWETNLLSDNDNNHFVRKVVLKPQNGHFTITVEPGHLYTITSTKGQEKGIAKPRANIYERMKLPYKEDFENYAPGELAKFYSDVNGAFETAPSEGGRSGLSYRQELTEKPISWWHGVIQPATFMGDPRWWGDYKVGVDVLLEQPGYVELVARISGVKRSTQMAGYHLQVSSEGTWRLYSQQLSGQRISDKTIASGKVVFDERKWHRIALNMLGDKIDVIINGKIVGSVTDNTFTTGQIGFMVSPWQNAQFDNVEIIPTAEWPLFAPKSKMSIETTSDHLENVGGYDYKVTNAIDERPETVWNSEWEPLQPLPQALIINLGDTYKVKGFVYQPRLDDSVRGMITKYTISISMDGISFEPIAEGTWETGTGTKVVKWPESRDTRYIRFDAYESTDNTASAGEIDIIIEK